MTGTSYKPIFSTSLRLAYYALVQILFICSYKMLNKIGRYNFCNDVLQNIDVIYIRVL